MAQAEEKSQVLVCGGGNGAHVFAGLAASNPNIKCHWLSLFADEAERINKSLEKAPLTITYQLEKDKITESKPALVSNDPSKCIPGSDIIILCVPAFAHGQYLTAIAEQLGKDAKCVIAVFPGKGGITLQYSSIFKSKGLDPKAHALVNCITLPWACRIEEYGQKVMVLGTKEAITMISIGNASLDAIPKLQNVLGKMPLCKEQSDNHALSFTVGTSIVHPSTMYATWKDWKKDNKPLSEKPLFYQGVTKEGCDIMSGLSDETILVAEAINKKLPKDSKRTLQVLHVKDWYIMMYGKQCTDTSSLYGMLTTNPGYNGLTHPMKEVGKDQYVPNFRSRYLTEDIPFGSLVTKGLALLVGVETPILDSILTWAQGMIGKEYIDKDGQLTGKDVGNGRAPQSFGFKSIEDVLAVYM